MCEVNKEFREDVRFKNGKKVLYVQILKALYGMIESALLRYTLYAHVLQKQGFVINNIDKCVANKVINGKQCTIGWYVDDNIMGHKDSRVVTEVIAKIEERFPGLTVQRGKELEFLGLDLKFRDNRKVDIGNFGYLKGMIEDFEKEIGTTLNRKYAPPASSWLFRVK